MIKLAKNLWQGTVPLQQTFWRYAVVYGLLVNLVTSLLFLALVVNDVAPVLLVAAFVLPVPFNLFLIVAVWRSADRYRGPGKWADGARVGAVIWLLALTAA
jgi:hypothetical protein